MGRDPASNRIYMREYYRNRPLYREEQKDRARNWQAEHPIEHAQAVIRYRKRKQLAEKAIE